MDTITSFISMFVTQRQQSKPLPSPDINRYQARWAVSLYQPMGSLYDCNRHSLTSNPCDHGPTFDANIS
ncbi:hypothetical protein FOCG_03166 [Fusarium oxysporum f. sp. radicis-lycopersici 26381]|uniref:Uncharacterized protein n=1 Tax=Fusarium oxysporum Fo47 TaxID=660027 RepID=W9KAH9_FUSOX|nr:hypothetical protein FOZG_06680 [Fusarium oxysporum Fo47]EXA01541.1 hypothetical protein FOWG_01365 [Fusarium oxysporum f. sp. lycopersici MN25]EXL60224.1 hypothetical protein FOCG_03166 [Fusarium oxysporum f. sp. radicis-lycopersici 26381]